MLPSADVALKYFQIAAACVAILMPLAIIPIARLINKVRTNDLHHLDAKLDAHHKLMEQHIAGLSKAVTDLGGKFDRHIEWHLDRASRR